MIQKCASLGMTLDDISYIIDVARKTLVRRLKDDEDARYHYEKGRAEAKLKVVGKLFELIEAGEPAAIFFYLKCQCNWREKDKVELQEKPQIQIYLPQKNNG